MRRGVLRTVEGGGLMFWCPGCNGNHMVTVGEGHGARWTFNEDYDRPTFTPSILVRNFEWRPPVTPENLEDWKRAPWPQTMVETVCHSFVTDGQIQFLGDSTHALSGQTVPIPASPYGDDDGL